MPKGEYLLLLGLAVGTIAIGYLGLQPNMSPDSYTIEPRALLCDAALSAPFNKNVKGLPTLNPLSVMVIQVSGGRPLEPQVTVVEDPSSAPPPGTPYHGVDNRLAVYDDDDIKPNSDIITPASDEWSTPVQTGRPTCLVVGRQTHVFDSQGKAANVWATEPSPIGLTVRGPLTNFQYVFKNLGQILNPQGTIYQRSP